MAKDIALVGSALAELKVRDIFAAAPDKVRSTFTHDEKSLYDDIKGDYHQRFSEDLLWHHALGKKLHTALHDAEQNKKKYGNHLMERLARSLGERDPQRLYMSVQIFRVYPDKGRFLKEVARKAGPDGNHLTVTHLSHLVRIENPKQRDKLVEKVLTENLTAHETQNLVRDKRPETASSGNNPGGKPLKRHKTLGQTLAFMLVELPKLTKRVNDVWLGDTSILSMAEELDPVQATPEILHQAEKAKDEVITLRAALELLINGCDVAINAINKKAAKHRNDVEVAVEAAAKVAPGECPRGGKHVWVKEETSDGVEQYCENCKEPKPKATKKTVPPSAKKKGGKRAKAKDSPR